MEDAEALADWWGMVSRRPVPAAIAEAAAGGVVAAATVSEAEPGDVVDLDEVEEADDLGVGTLAREVAACAIELKKARLAGDRGRIATAQRQIREMSASLRQLKRTRDDLLRKSGAVVARDEVTAWVKRRELKWVQALGTALGRAVERARSELTEGRVLVAEERDRVFRALKEDGVELG